MTTKPPKCICGDSLRKGYVEEYCQRSSIFGICSGCHLKTYGKDEVYFCERGGYYKFHKYGYLLCIKCHDNWQIIHSQNDAKILNKTPICVCGQKLRIEKAKDCYQSPGCSCDKCLKPMIGDEPVYHCDGNQDDCHNGFDLCTDCVNILSKTSVFDSKPNNFLMVKSNDYDKREVFGIIKRYYSINEEFSKDAIVESLNCESITSYLTSKQGKAAFNDFIAFNNQRYYKAEKSSHSNIETFEFEMTEILSRYTNVTPKQDNVKFEGKIKRLELQNDPISKFPTMIAHIRTDDFVMHDQLKKYMNLFQMNEGNDIFNREMPEKSNKNKKWNVVGLIDPNTNLSTLDHSLNMQSLNIQNERTEIINYHHWIPTVFRVNKDLTECQLLSEIPNLNPYKYKNTLYPLIEKLFLFQLPQFENVTKYNLRNFPLKVIVKAQDYRLFDCKKNDCYLGNFHKEGLYEDIIAVGLYYYQIDKDINGGQLELSSFIRLRNTAKLKDTKVNVKEKMSIVFSNDLCYHKVSSLFGNGSRKIICFFLLRPNESSLNISIDARFVVTNWKFHTEYLLLKWLKKEALLINGYQFMLNVIIEFVIGDRKYIQKATNLYTKCRRSYKQKLAKYRGKIEDEVEDKYAICLD